MVFSTTIFHFINFLLYIHGIIISLKKEVNHMIMHNDWDQLFDQEIQKDYFRSDDASSFCPDIGRFCQCIIL